MTLTVAKIIQCQCQMWSIGRIIMTGKNQNIQRKTWPSVTLSTTNLIHTGLQVNPGVCDERSGTNRLLYRSVPMCMKLATYAKYCISNTWTVLFYIKYPSLLVKEQPVKTALNSLF